MQTSADTHAARFIATAMLSQNRCLNDAALHESRRRAGLSATTRSSLRGLLQSSSPPWLARAAARDPAAAFKFRRRGHKPPMRTAAADARVRCA
eukprot:364446-Chlamydomonas_euryale.AAC.8